MDNKWLFSAGIVSLFISIMHLIGGQITLVDPLLESNLIGQEKVEWLGAWHAITILLFGFAYVLLKNGLKYNTKDASLIKSILVLCILFSFSFIFASVYLQKHAPQYIFFLPVALIIYFGLKKTKEQLS